jgi:hypothetical protein
MAIFMAEDANTSLTPLEQGLARSNIPYNSHVRTGDKATEIVKVAKALYCPQIILGPTTGNRIVDLLFGTLSARVESLMRIADNRCEVL